MQSVSRIVARRPNNYLISAILVTLLCCIPFGIIGIVYSVDSSRKFDYGDGEGAARSARSAKRWSIAGLLFGIIIIVVVCIIMDLELKST
ncbi:transmembrane protein 233-like [Antedon mediterranea]|uniref:transmembrane protein 233-like n=1 Tax=Antedon mediterranea TaxID=105859 RepID=UPI003AF94987